MKKKEEKKEDARNVNKKNEDKYREKPKKVGSDDKDEKGSSI